MPLRNNLFVKQGAKVSAPIPGNIVAAITAAVNVVTQGKGKVTKTRKSEN